MRPAVLPSGTSSKRHSYNAHECTVLASAEAGFTRCDDTAIIDTVPLTERHIASGATSDDMFDACRGGVLLAINEAHAPMRAQEPVKVVLPVPRRGLYSSVFKVC
jgi:hypothetical protein